MAVIVHTSVRLGDMQAQYLLDEQTLQLGLRLLPAGMEPLPRDAKRHGVDSCVQTYVTGDVFSNGYAGGKTLRQSGTTRALQLERIQIQTLPGGGKTVKAFLRIRFTDSSATAWTGTAAAGWKAIRPTITTPPDRCAWRPCRRYLCLI